MANNYYNASQLRMEVVRGILDFVSACEGDDKLFHEINPESGRRSGPDKFTELQGFRRDAQLHIQEPLLNAFPAGASVEDIAEFLLDVPNTFETTTESAGPFLVRLSEELLVRMCPDQAAQHRVLVQENEEPPQEDAGENIAQITLEQFSAAARGIPAGEAWRPSFIDEANATNQFDVLTESNKGQFFKALEQQAGRYLDDEGLDWEWPDVQEQLEAAFAQAVEMTSEAAANEVSDQRQVGARALGGPRP